MSRKRKKKPAECRVCGGKFTADGRCNICELLGNGGGSNAVVGGTQTTGWPMVSEALAVNPRDVRRANDRAKRHGINVKYDRKGFAHIPDRNERHKLLKLEGLVDKSSFTGY